MKDSTVAVMVFPYEGVMCSIDVGEDNLKVGERRKGVFQSFTHLFTHLATLGTHRSSSIH